MNKTSLLVAGALLSAAAAVHAENYVAFDSFGTSLLNATKYSGALERSRVVQSGVLLMAQRDLGNQTSDFGSLPLTWGTNIRNPEKVTQMQVTMKATNATVTDCASNPNTPSFVQQRMFGTFFSAQPVAAGDLTNDVMAIARLGRFNADAAGTLRVDALVIQCTSADCNTSTTLWSQQMGSVNVNSPATVRVDWDKPNKRFIFRYAGSTFLAAYAVSDANPPSRPFKQLGTRTSLANCFSGQRTEGYVRGVFENFSVNASALQ
jgi:hypothetical protein